LSLLKCSASGGGGERVEMPTSELSAFANVSGTGLAGNVAGGLHARRFPLL